MLDVVNYCHELSAINMIGIKERGEFYNKVMKTFRGEGGEGGEGVIWLLRRKSTK